MAPDTADNMYQFQTAGPTFGDSPLDAHTQEALWEKVRGVFKKPGKPRLNPEWSGTRRRVGKVVNSLAGELAMTAVMFFNLVLAVLIVDIEASGDVAPHWMQTCMHFLVGAYCLEVCAHIYVMRCDFFFSAEHLFDIVVVTADVISCMFQLFLSAKGAPDFAIMRLVRVIRLLRSAKILILFRSLYLIVHGMTAAVKAVMWGLIMISFVLILCSVFAVVVIQPYVDELVANSDVFDGCARCGVAYKSVWHAYMSLFRQIVAGDSWGEVIMIVMDMHPWTAMFFIPVTLLIQLGLINMILAVIVDKAQDAREQDAAHILEMKQLSMRQARVEMLDLCRNMDKDGSGELSFDEIVSAFANNHKVADIFRLMDIGLDDMKTVFGILDHDKSGACGFTEFADSLWKMKSQDSRTLLVLVKAHLAEVKLSLEESLGILKNDVASKLAELHMSQLEEKGGSFSHMKVGEYADPSGECITVQPKIRFTAVQGETSAAQKEVEKKDIIGGDLQTEKELATCLKHMTEKIEQLIDTFAKVIPTRPISVDGLTVTPVTSSSNTLPFILPSPPHPRNIPARWCLAAESDVVTKAPNKTVCPQGEARRASD